MFSLYWIVAWLKAQIRAAFLITRVTGKGKPVNELPTAEVSLGVFKSFDEYDIAATGMGHDYTNARGWVGPCILPQAEKVLREALFPKEKRTATVCKATPQDLGFVGKIGKRVPLKLVLDTARAHGLYPCDAVLAAHYQLQVGELKPGFGMREYLMFAMPPNEVDGELRVLGMRMNRYNIDLISYLFPADEVPAVALDQAMIFEKK